jgi:hypothetical protein
MKLSSREYSSYLSALLDLYFVADGCEEQEPSNQNKASVPNAAALLSQLIFRRCLKPHKPPKLVGLAAL